MSCSESSACGSEAAASACFYATSLSKIPEPIRRQGGVPGCVLNVAVWPAPGSEDTELGVLMELEVGHGETEVYAGVQA
jgi:hypothetical protein